MKKVLFILMAIVVVTVTINAQTTTTKPKVEDYLTPAQQLQFEKDLQLAEMEKKMEQYGKWVGVGGEVGQAINEGLMAVVDVSDKFGKTDVGKFTLVMVAWKVMGKDIVRIFLGIIFLTIISVFIFKSYKSSFTSRRVLIKNPGFLNFPKEYEVVRPTESSSDWESAIWYKALYMVILTGAIGITYAIMFGGA